MKLGISTYAFAWSIGVPGYPPPNPMDVYSFLETCNILGAECVQIADNIPLTDLSQQELEEIKLLAGQYDLRIEIGMRGMVPERLYSYLELACFFDSPFVRVVIDDKGYEPTQDEISVIIRDFLPELESRGRILALENHDRFRAHVFRELVESTDPRFVGICLDPVNSLGQGEGFYEVAGELLPYTINLHIKDYSINRLDHQMGFRVTGTPAGQGMLPMDWLWSKLTATGRCQSAVPELWPPFTHSIEETIAQEASWASKSIRYLQPFRSTRVL